MGICRRACVFLPALLVGFAATVGAGKTTPDRKPSRPGIDTLESGRVELGLLVGAGIAHQIWDGVADRQFFLVGGRVGKVLTTATGPGALKGHLAFAFETLPVFLMFQEATAYGASFTLLLRHYLAPGSTVRPFVSLGAGALVTTDPVPRGATRLNFTPQAGLGVAVFRESTAFVFEYRLHHISNADLGGSNPGINSSHFQFGISLFR